MHTTNNNSYLITILLFVLQISATNVWAAEKSIADEAMGTMEESVEKAPMEKRDVVVGAKIEASLNSGKAHWLSAGDDKFLAIHTPYNPSKQRTSEGTILLLHDLGANADWPRLISPLRTRLPDAGWNTLSIQLPMLEVGKEKGEFLRELDVAIARVGTAITFLRDQQSGKIVIAGHGFGAAVAVLYLNKNPQQIAAFVGLSMPGANSLKSSGEAETPEKSPATATETNPSAIEDRDFFAELEKLKLPMLDIYGDGDHRDVTREAEKRAMLMLRFNQKSYIQIQISGADHYFIGLEGRLIKRIRGWLRKNARS